MDNVSNLIHMKKLETLKGALVPYIFSEKYFNILKAKLQGKRLDDNERYYYNHFIKKKIIGMAELFMIKDKMNIQGNIRKDRLQKAEKLIRKYSKKHKKMKILISGSFLYSKKYNDIDLFVISKYNKEDYREGKIHINYLPDDVENKLFFKSISGLSVSNFAFKEEEIRKELPIEDVLQLYETVALLIMQKDNFKNELRDLMLTLEYLSNGVVLDSMQLKKATEKIIKRKNKLKILNAYLTMRIITSYPKTILQTSLNRFIGKNSNPEKGQKIYNNWKVYNQTYHEALEIAE